MPEYARFIRENLHRFRQIETFLPFDNPTFGNPDFEDASIGLAQMTDFQPLFPMPHNKYQTRKNSEQLAGSQETVNA